MDREISERWSSVVRSILTVSAGPANASAPQATGARTLLGAVRRKDLLSIELRMYRRNTVEDGRWAV